MPRATTNPLAIFKLWSVIGWSVQHNLLALNLARFIVDSSITVDDINSDSDFVTQASCTFIQPSQVTLSKFSASARAVIQKVNVSHPSKGLSTYRFGFEGDSFIEIVARDCSTVAW